MNRNNCPSAVRSLVPRNSRLVLVLTTLFLLASVLLVRVNAHASPRVEIFITSWCPYCQMLEKTLKGSGVPFTKYDIEKNETAKRIHGELGGGGVPVTRIDGKTVIRGYNPEAIQDALRHKPAGSESSI